MTPLAILSYPDAIAELVPSPRQMTTIADDYFETVGPTSQHQYDLDIHCERAETMRTFAVGHEPESSLPLLFHLLPTELIFKIFDVLDFRSLLVCKAVRPSVE